MIQALLELARPRLTEHEFNLLVRLHGKMCEYCKQNRNLEAKGVETSIILLLDSLVKSPEITLPPPDSQRGDL